MDVDAHDAAYKGSRSEVEGEVDRVKMQRSWRGRAKDSGQKKEAREMVVMVTFDEATRAITPGQVVALYKDSVCLGGGPILRPEGMCAPVRYLPPPQPPVTPPRSRRRRNGKPHVTITPSRQGGVTAQGAQGGSLSS